MRIVGSGHETGTSDCCFYFGYNGRLGASRADYRMEETEIMGGRVLAHDADKRNLAMRAKELALPECPKTIFFTGKLPRRAKVELVQKISS